MTSEPPPQSTLRFVAGTLELTGISREQGQGLPEVAWDERTLCFRAPAVAYAKLVLALRRIGIAHLDEARRYPTLETGMVAWGIDSSSVSSSFFAKIFCQHQAAAGKRLG